MTRIVRLTLDDVIHDAGQVSIRLGDPPSPVPEPFARLLLDHLQDRPNTATATDPDSRWLFPGRRLAARLRGRLRILTGRRKLPTAGCVDSQTVRAAETVGAAACGYDAGKKLKGQKRHVVVDTLGLLLCVMVTRCVGARP
ncbi:transposase [Nonomuraea jabiensis]|uniref:transposase n=1 Tax=Nonomuraea jabiensis TaxID=882448 RepID=UPI003D73F517